MPYCWTYKLFLIFFSNKECSNEYHLHMLLSTFASEITMSKEMTIKNDHYPPKTVPIYTPNTNMSAQFQNFSLIRLLSIILTNFVLLYLKM